MRATITALVLLLGGCKGDGDLGADVGRDDTGWTSTWTGGGGGGGGGGTNPTGPGTTAGGSQTCVWLGGGNARVRGGDDHLPLGSEGRTAQIWVRTTSMNEQVAFSWGRPAPGLGFYVGTVNGMPMISNGSTQLVATGPSIADDQWHHLAGTWDGASATIVVDGELVLDDVFEVATLEGDVVAGSTPSGDAAPWIGWLDDARVFSRARHASQIADDPEGEDIDQYLLLWWDMEVEGQGPGITVPDRSPYDADGVTGGDEMSPEFTACR